MRNLAIGEFVTVSAGEACSVLGGDFIVPTGPDSNSDPDAKFILIPDGQPNYDQETESQEEYYNQYRIYNTDALLTFGVNQNNNSTFTNTLSLVSNISGVGTRSNVVVVPTPITNILTFWVGVNQYPAPHIGSASFVNNTAHVHLDQFQSDWSVDVTATLTDRGDGTTGASIVMVTSSPYGSPAQS